MHQFRKLVLSGWKHINHQAFTVLLVWLVILFFLYSALSILRHNHYQSGAFDLGIYDQAIWQYSRLQFPYNTVKERLILGDHLNLTLPLLSPLYWIWNDVRALLLFQALWITFSTIPVYFLCRIRKLPAITSLMLSLLYSIFYGIQFAVYFDFHPVIIGIGLLAWTLYFYESGKKRLYLLFLLLTLLTQENMGLTVAGIGFLYFFEKNHRKTGILYIIGGLVFSFAAVTVAGLLSPVGYQYWPAVSGNIVDLVNKLFDSSDKRLVWLFTFSWFSFIPLLSLGGILAIMMDLSQYFLPSKEFGHMVTPFLHHRAILSLFVVLATIQVLERYRTKKKLITILSIVLLLSALAQQYIFHFPLNKLSKPDYWQKEQWMRNNAMILASVPPQASVAASQNLVPHIAHRNHIYLVWPRLHGNDWWLDFAGKPDYLVADLRGNQWVTQLLESPENFIAAVANMEKAGALTREKQIGDAILFRINSNASE